MASTSNALVIGDDMGGIPPVGDVGGKVLLLGAMIIENVFKDIAQLTRRQMAGEISEAEALQGFRDLILTAFDPKSSEMTDAQIPVYAAAQSATP
jgi:hypothetical protein